MKSIAVDVGRLTVAAAKMYPLSEASCEAGSMRGARRSSLGFSNQSARRHQNAANTASCINRVDEEERVKGDLTWLNQIRQKQ